MFVHVKFFSKTLNYIFFQGKKKNPGLFSGASIGFPEQSMAEWGTGTVTQLPAGSAPAEEEPKHCPAVQWHGAARPWW